MSIDVKATLINGLDYPVNPDSLIPGAFYIPLSTTLDNKTVLKFICPCGCNDFISIPIKLGDKIDGCWQWDGNLELPTIMPSIRRLDGCKFHGHLREGRWTGELE